MIAAAVLLSRLMLSMIARSFRFSGATFSISNASAGMNHGWPCSELLRYCSESFLRSLRGRKLLGQPVHLHDDRRGRAFHEEPRRCVRARASCLATLFNSTACPSPRHGCSGSGLRMKCSTSSCSNGFPADEQRVAVLPVEERCTCSVPPVRCHRGGFARSAESARCCR